jgi:hypothetical protein
LFFFFFFFSQQSEAIPKTENSFFVGRFFRKQIRMKIRNETARAAASPATTESERRVQARNERGNFSFQIALTESRCARNLAPITPGAFLIFTLARLQTRQAAVRMKYARITPGTFVSFQVRCQVHIGDTCSEFIIANEARNRLLQPRAL